MSYSKKIIKEDYQFAAKAAGYEIGWANDRAWVMPHYGPAPEGELIENHPLCRAWVPDEVDGDAFRLMVAVHKWAHENPIAWQDQQETMQNAYFKLDNAMSSGDTKAVKKAIFELAIETGKVK